MATAMFADTVDLPTPPFPENKYYIFGKDGCKNLAEQLNLPLLAQIPIVQSVCENGDNGTPAAMDVASPTGQAFLALAQGIVSKVRLL